MINKSIVDAVVTMLKMHDVDGETMEFIIAEVGMTDQMVKQLYHDKQDQGPEVDGAGFTEADREQPTYTFTEEELITFSAKLVERTLDVVEESISDTDIDDDMIILELDHSNQINIDIDQHSIRKVFKDNICIETDNDSIKDEITDILSKMDK
jgi:hypothetical protein